MVRWLCLLLSLFVSSPALAEDPAERIRLWVEVVSEGRAPFPQEMVILKVHGRYRIPVTLEKLEEPEMPDFRVFHLGRDRWYDAFEEGLSIRSMERTYAVFPQRSGELQVPPFVHHLTVLDSRMQQVRIDVETAPVAVRVQPAPEIAGDWWLPARDLKVEESWTVAPEALGIGQSTRRTLTISGWGVADDQLPPPPPMRADGLIVFPAQTERRTRMGLGIEEVKRPLREQSLRRPELYETVASEPLGPFSSVTYSWAIRPATDKPVTLPEIRLPWYDSRGGRIREVVIPERTVAYGVIRPDQAALERALGIVGDTGPEDGGPGWPVAAFSAGFGAFLASMAIGTLLLDPGLAGRWLAARAERRRRRAALGAIRRAERAGDGAAMRRGIEAWRAAGGDAPAARAALDAVDRSLYAADTKGFSGTLGIAATLSRAEAARRRETPAARAGVPQTLERST